MSIDPKPLRHHPVRPGLTSTWTIMAPPVPERHPGHFIRLSDSSRVPAKSTLSMKITRLRRNRPATTCATRRRVGQECAEQDLDEPVIPQHRR